ncbi:F-box protein cpr1 [Thalictrum thalictroides]|uniref:F-box protein cpr1 n=1 Tax=Thalictrum thalictroides TaxID=46969 RepID=A0A7J6VF53_THATH|nr:F-box protein cpr1 [Thalictrum thalictroides]
MEKLPPEITTNILSRLPIKSSVQCRCVCKPWCEILTDSKFPLIHLNQISTISPDILVYSISHEILYLDDSKEAFGRKPIKPFKVFSENFMHNSFYKKDSIVLGSCNGLICLAKFEGPLTPSNPICIFNPITETCSKLPDYKDPEFEMPTGLNHKRFMYGFGFDDSKQEFKFVLVTFFSNLSEVQICTLGDSTWRRKTGCAPDVLNLASRQHSTAFVNQCLHWVADVRLTIPIIVSFNSGVEEFDFVPIPPSNKLRKLTVGVLEGHLSAVDYTYVNYIHIWVMKKYKVKESWVKQFSIKHDLICRDCDHFFCYFETLKFRKNGELLLLCNGRDFLSYNIRSRKIMIYKIEEDKGRATVTVAREKLYVVVF